MTKKIKLTQNKFALVDAINYDWLNLWKWYAHKSERNWYAYRAIKDNGKVITICMHRVILGLDHYDSRIVDHVNRNGLDNRISNLRIANFTINARNRRKQINNTSGFSGVGWDKRENKWRARIKVNNKLISLGRYTNKLDAIKARKKGELIYWKQEK